MKSFKLLIIIAIMVLCSFSANALLYTNETVSQSIVDYEWRFNPEIQKDMYKENFEPYIDIVSGCEDITIEMYAVLPIKDTITTYHDETTCQLKDNKTAIKINGTFPQYNDCTTTNQSKTQSIEYEEWFDLSKTDVFMTTEMYWVIKGKRKASTLFQSCDINFYLDQDNDGIKEFTTAMDNKLWFNLTFLKKYQFNVTETTRNNNFTFGMSLNSSHINFNDFQIDGGDLRVVNGTEDGEVAYTLVNWNKTTQTGSLLINATTKGVNNTYYLYGNSTSLLTTTSQKLIDHNESLTAYYSMNNDFTNSTHSLDSLRNIDAVRIPTITTGQTGKDLEAYKFDGTSSLLNTTIDLTDETSYSISAWVNVTVDVDQALMGQDHQSSRVSALQYAAGTNKIGHYDGTGSTDTLLGISLNTLYHVVITNNNTGDHKMYLDGVLQETISGNVPASSPKTVNIGRRAYTTSEQYYSGMLDEISFYQGRVLNQTTITEMSQLLTYPFYAEPIINVGNVLSSDSTPQFSNFVFKALNGTGTEFAGDEVAFNGLNIESIEKMRIQFTISDIDGIANNSIFFTANGTDACSLGNRQSMNCLFYPTLIEWQNNSVTTYFNDTSASSGDKFNCSVAGTSTLQNWTCDIDEHYNPNVYKNYPLDFTDINWQTGINQRINSGNFWKVQINNTIIPNDADFYKLDFRVSAVNSTPAPNQDIFAYMCNSSYSTGDPTISSNCMLVASKNPAQLTDDGTKFRGVFPKSFVSGLNELNSVVIGSNAINPRYYAMKTARIAGGQESNVFISTDSGSSYNQLVDGYETELNINFFNNGTGTDNATSIIFKLWANDTLGNEGNSSLFEMTWNLSLTANVPPILTLLTPSENAVVNESLSITWSGIDGNGDTWQTNITLSNSTNSTIILLNSPLTSYTFNSSLWTLGDYDLNVTICENATTEGLCDSTIINISLGNDIPVVTWDNSTPLLIGSIPSNVSWTVTDLIGTGVTTCTLLYNGTLNETTTNRNSHLFNASENTYNLSVSCFDGWLNSSSYVSLVLSYTDNCVPLVFGDIEEGGRYRELVKTIGVNCSNSVAISNCWYSTNQYSLESVSNCSLFNVTLQKGWNDLSVIVDDGFNTTSSFSVWATDPTSNVFDFVLLWVYFLSLALFYVLAVLTGLGVFYAFGGFMGLLIGYELVALSPWMGLAVGVAILIGSLTMLILKKQS